MKPKNLLPILAIFIVFILSAFYEILRFDPAGMEFRFPDRIYHAASFYEQASHLWKVENSLAAPKIIGLVFSPRFTEPSKTGLLPAVASGFLALFGTNMRSLFIMNLAFSLILGLSLLRLGAIAGSPWAGFVTYAASATLIYRGFGPGYYNYDFPCMAVVAVYLAFFAGSKPFRSILRAVLFGLFAGFATAQRTSFVFFVAGAILIEAVREYRADKANSLQTVFAFAAAAFLVLMPFWFFRPIRLISDILHDSIFPRPGTNLEMDVARFAGKLWMYPNVLFYVIGPLLIAVLPMTLRVVRTKYGIRPHVFCWAFIPPVFLVLMPNKHEEFILPCLPGLLFAGIAPILIASSRRIKILFAAIVIALGVVSCIFLTYRYPDAKVKSNALEEAVRQIHWISKKSELFGPGQANFNSGRKSAVPNVAVVEKEGGFLWGSEATALCNRILLDPKLDLADDNELPPDILAVVAFPLLSSAQRKDLLKNPYGHYASNWPSKALLDMWQKSIKEKGEIDIDMEDPTPWFLPAPGLPEDRMGWLTNIAESMQHFLPCKTRIAFPNGWIGICVKHP